MSNNKNGIARKILPIIQKISNSESDEYNFKVCREIVSIVKNDLLDGNSVSEILQHLANNGFTAISKIDSNNVYMVECYKKGNLVLSGRGETIDSAFQNAVSSENINGWLGMSRV